MHIRAENVEIILCSFYLCDTMEIGCLNIRFPTALRVPPSFDIRFLIVFSDFRFL
jgi:hypothetical protein